MPVLKPRAKNWKPGALLITIPYQGVIIRRPRVVLNPRQAAYMQVSKMAVPSQAVTPSGIQPASVQPRRKKSAPTIEPLQEVVNVTNIEQFNQLYGDEESPPLRIHGKEVTAEEKRLLTGFFNNPHNRSLALTINNIGNRVMDAIAENRPLTWAALATTLSQKQLESAVKWLRSTYCPTWH
jgi:hypothetical protein